MADVTIGARLQLDGKDAEASVKSIKTQLKEAQQEVVKLSEKFGSTSKEATAAAKRAAELKDAIGDAKSLVDAFNPDQKFRAFSQSLGGVLGGFTALTGAMGLLGVESEEVQKQLLKVQSAMALSQGLNQVGDAIQSFKNLGTVIVNTLGRGGAIGLAIAGVTALGLAIYSAFKNTEKLTEEQKRYNEASDRALKSEGARIAGLQILIEKIKKGGLTQAEKTKTLEDYNTNLGDTLGKYATYQKLEAALIANGPKYIQYLQNKAKADAAYGMLVEEYQKRLTAERTKSSEFTGFSILGIFFDDETTHKANKDKAIARIDGDINTISSLYDKAKGEADKLQSELNITTGTGTANVKGGATTDRGKIAKSSAEEEAKYLKIAREYEMEQFKKKIEVKKIENGELAALDNERFMNSAALQEATTLTEQNNVAARIQLAEQERAAKVQAAQSIGGALGALSDIVGKQTAAGKVLGIAQATINTFIGASEVLRAKSTIPEPFGTISKIANVAAIIATGMSAVKNIVKTKVPGYSAGSGGSASVSTSAPITPQLPNATRTTLDQQQLNQIGNATVRAFVVESDVSGSQDRIRRLNRAARL